MPSRRLLSLPPTPSREGVNHHLPTVTGGVTAAFSCLLLLTMCFRRISKKRTAPTAASDTDSKKPPHRLSYSLLRRATSNFSPSLRIGQGGFGSVYRGDLKKDSALTSSLVAVKLMDSGSLQGEREFQNELIFSSRTDCKHIVSVLGFSSNSGKHRMLLIYELMEKGSLQDCLFHKKSEELRNWDKRFSIALNIARGLEYLHHYCDPPIIHGDIKPSNILLDKGFNAKIADFGLAKFKGEDNVMVEGEGNLEDNVSVMEDTESVITIDEVNTVSPQSVVVRVETSPEVVVGIKLKLSPEDELGKKKKSVSGKDSGGAEEESGRVKDYVMEWIGNEIKERPRSKWIEEASSSTTKMDRNKKENKRRPTKEWWKEEQCKEVRKKKNHNIHESLISSTPSMRGTVCYIAPEYCGGGSDVSEKCDVYSYGVLLLVLIAGRRPLEVTGSPMSEFKRANLLSWARHLARGGKLLELVDQRMRSGGLDREQALMCITLALLCLQKLPQRRPTMKEVVGMMCGELGAPQLPVEFLGSSRGRFMFKGQNKVVG